MLTDHVGDLTFEELRSLIREELKDLIRDTLQEALAAETRQTSPEVHGFPVFDVGPWPENFVEEREGRDED